MRNSLSARNFTGLARGKVRGSGGRGLKAGDADYLTGGEGEDAEHQMAFDLDRAAHAQHPGGKFVLQAGVEALDCAAKGVDHIVGVGHADEFHALDPILPLGQGHVPGAKGSIDDRPVAKRAPQVMIGGGVVGFVHEIAEIGDVSARDDHQSNGDLTVVNGAAASGRLSRPVVGPQGMARTATR